MNLERTITIFAGGPGSGCNPEKGKCGRPGAGTLSPGTALKKELFEKTTGNPFNPRESIYNNESGIEVTYNPRLWNDRTIHIDLVRAFEMGKGAGTRAMNLLTDLADKHRVTLNLYAKPVGTGGLNKVRLISFYKKHGFVQDPDSAEKGDLIRYPKKQ